MLLAVGLAALTLGLTDDGASPRPFAISAVLVAAGVAALALFARVELRARVPMLDVRVLRNRSVAAAAVAYLLIGAALITALVNVPLMADVLFAQSTTSGGLTLMRLLLFLPLGGLAGGWLATRAGYRSTVLTGIALALAGFVWMRLWPYHPGVPFPTHPATHTRAYRPRGSCGARWARSGSGSASATARSWPRWWMPSRRSSGRPRRRCCSWSGPPGMIVGLALLATQGLGAFGRRVSVVVPDAPDYQLRLQGILHRTFDETIVAAVVALGIAFVVAFALRGGHAAEVHLSPYEALGE